MDIHGIHMCIFQIPSGKRLQFAIENCPFIIDLPIKNDDDIHSYVCLPEGNQLRRNFYLCFLAHRQRRKNKHVLLEPQTASINWQNHPTHLTSFMSVAAVVA